jgi:hypothetical protein
VPSHEGEVALDLREVVILGAVLVGLERPVRHTADVELLVTAEEELPVYTGSCGAPNRRCSASRDRGYDICRRWLGSDK